MVPMEEQVIRQVYALHGEFGRRGGLAPAPPACLQRRETGVVSDAALVDRFARLRDESAFELLVWRHGAMVMGVCRRVLGNAHDAEDAFQATMFTLARQAANIRQRQFLATWLYKVAYRVALRARENAALRREREQTVGAEVLRQVPAPARVDLAWREVGPALDEEIHRLPDKLRTVFILCCLEQKTNEEAATELGLPVGTVHSRLCRARRRLRAGLEQRGLGWTLAGLARPAWRDEPNPGIVRATTRQAWMLAAGSLTLDQLRPEVAVLLEAGVASGTTWTVRILVGLLVGLLLGGIGYWAHAGAASSGTPTPKPTPSTGCCSNS
ncbi:MAG: RNA polymerase sigma factor [Gemmataceae bacterium]|nr:RNA polymerase sigma factor [Gemmataceae bacterium]